MENAGFIVSIDLGTSKIVGLLGRKNEQGVISILASETIASDGCIRNGVVYNIDETVGKIKKLINLLENKSGKKIGKVYVSVAGRSLRAIEHMQTRALEFESVVTFAALDEMEQLARQNKPDFLTNYSVVAPEIFLDGKLESDPIDKQASLIESRYRLIVGRPNIKNNLQKVITEKNQLEIAGYIVGPVATGAIVLDDEEKQEGCALVDFGAGTTTVSIYKGGLLRYMTVIPFGGRSVTRDIQDLGFMDSLAESYKIKYGRVGKDKSRSNTTSNEVDVKELNRVIQLRVEEIVLNVINQIRESGYIDKLESGIVMTGGASQMAGLFEFLAEKSKMNVRIGSAKRLYINNAADLLQNPSFAQALGLLLFANENCEKRAEVRIPQASTYESYAQNVNAQAQPTNEQYKASQTEVVNDKEAVEIENKPNEKVEEKSKKPAKEEKRQRNLFDFFGKIQNLGGTVFKDEE